MACNPKQNNFVLDWIARHLTRIRFESYRIACNPKRNNFVSAQIARHLTRIQFELYQIAYYLVAFKFEE